MNAAATPPDLADSPFHEGERQLQQLTGQAEVIAQRGRAMIRDHMPEQHRSFFAQRPFMLVGGLDAQQQPWATLWAGPPGFAHSPDPHSLVLQPHMVAGDPLARAWQVGAPIGLLGIEPHTRRRNRMNGVLTGVGPDGLQVAVRQSFGNCPQYIQPRRVSWHTSNTTPPPGARPADTAAGTTAETACLGAQATALIRGADVLFIASASAQARPPCRQGGQGGQGLDVSHRGGMPGFVRVSSSPADGATQLTLPDYAGNQMFNTLGNILQEPRIGLLFVDFEARRLLWLAATAQVDTDSPDLADHPGAQRLLHIRIVQGWFSAPGSLPLQALPAE